MTAFSPVSTQTLSRVAVLIDGDHIPATLRPAIVQQAQRMGQVISTQLFCDLSLRADWATETGLDAQHCKGRPGKNNTDISLCIAALDLAYRGLAGSFLIVSNERDFEPVLRHLNRMGCAAQQMKQLPPAVTKTIQPPPLPKEKNAENPVAFSESDLTITLVRHAIKTQGTTQGLSLCKLNHVLSATGFRISLTPQKTWNAWIKAHPDHFACDPKGPNTHVRLKP
jgi:hypothetical protein